MTTVQFISATWCKRCQLIRPDVMVTCNAAGLVFDYVDYDEIEDEALKASVTSLPTIRMRKGESWSSWTAATLEDWKNTVLTIPLVTENDF